MQSAQILMFVELNGMSISQFYRSCKCFIFDFDAFCLQRARFTFIFLFTDVISDLRGAVFKIPMGKSSYPLSSRFKKPLEV
jgi:hypothetical protein